MSTQRPSYESQNWSSLAPPQVEWPPTGTRSRPSNKGLWILIAIGGSVIAVLAIVVTAIVLIVVPAASRRTANQQVLAEIEQHSEHMRQSALQALDDERGSMISAGALTDYIDNFEKTSSQLTGFERDAATAGATVMRHLNEAVREYEAAVNNFVSLGGVAPANLTSVAMIDRRIETATAMKHANARLSEIIRQLPERFRSELAKSNPTPRALESAVAGFTDGSRLDLLASIRNEDVIICDRAIAILGVFKSQWGRWSVAADGETVLFDDDAIVPRYNKLIEDLDGAAARQMDLQRQMLTQPKPPGSGR